MVGGELSGESFLFRTAPPKTVVCINSILFCTKYYKTKKDLFYFLNKQFKSPAFGWNCDALNDAQYAI